ncbi:hypothetical protein BT69DRAFT_1286553 [Atractiella rhizophila]|nr:hypothetical protein BT69DRAFT_1286553 [Atractiella rhizophila]
MLLVLTHPLALSTSYVASLYLFKPRQQPSSDAPVHLPRDNPAVIRARLTGLSLSTIASFGLLALRYHRSGLSILGWRGLFDLLGLQVDRQAIKASIVGVGLTASLFAGPLFVEFLDRKLPGQKWFSLKRCWGDVTSWIGLRNWVFAPLTEELIFRSFTFASEFIMTNGMVDWKWLVFFTPVYFGVAHAHHIWESYVQSGRTRDGLIRGSIQAAFQFSYTTLFGWYSSYLFFRTGSVYPSIFAHTFCNMMGFPTLGYDLDRYPEKKQSIICSYIAGIVAFTAGMVGFVHTREFVYWPALL